MGNRQKGMYFLNVTQYVV